MIITTGLWIVSTSNRIDSKITRPGRWSLQSGVWSMKTLAMETGKEFSGKLESNLNYAKGSFAGTIINSSKLDG